MVFKIFQLSKENNLRSEEQIIRSEYRGSVISNIVYFIDILVRLDYSDQIQFSLTISILIINDDIGYFNYQSMVLYRFIEHQK